MPDVTKFLPSSRGFSFGNSWPSQADKLIPTPFGNIAIGNASNGLCGGMVFAVRDYFETNLMQPSGRQPALGQPLYNFIVDRLFGSFDLPNGPAKYYDWMTTSDHDTWIKNGLAHRTILEEWPRIKADLDNNQLSCLGLVTIFSLNPGDMGQNHQVLTYGYDLGPGAILTLKLYDPNSPLRDDIRLSLNLGNPAHTTPINHNVNITHPIRGFFRIPYQRVNPPQIDDAEINTFVAPMAMPARAQSAVTLRVQNTGTTTWAPGGANPYRLGSQRPQDNTTWGESRVELPQSVSPGSAVDFNFTVTAPAAGGNLPMGWQMLRENIHWFGELEERSVNVVAPPVSTTPCDQLRNEILAAKQDILDFQEELRQAAGQRKAFLSAQIKMKQTELTKLHGAATAQGCQNIP